MLTKLTAIECRVIGVLLEKEITTPDQYPLSLNGLTTGCNQKSNRDPVMQLSESDVQNALDDLSSKRQVMEDQYTSRVSKYKHKFCNTEFGSLKFTPQQTAIVCLLLLRGPQTPGELRSRSGRLAEFDNVQQVEKDLEELTEFNGETLVVRLPREPGKRESRYMHCFSDEELQSAQNTSPEIDTTAVSSTGLSTTALPARAGSSSELEDRVANLEEQVSALQEQLATLQELLD